VDIDVSNKKILSIIISYNDSRNTSMTVSSLLKQTVPVKIVVWDNDSKDNTCEILENKFGTNIIIHKSKENFYWAPAINKALEIYYDGEDFIHYSNNDIEYPNETLERMMIDVIETGAGALGPTGAGIGGLQDYATHQHSKDGDFDNFNDRYDFLKNKKPTRTSSLQGACVFMPAIHWKLVGPLDNSLPLGADDSDYSIRLKEKGYSLYVCEKAYVFHRDHASGPGNEQTWHDLGGQSWAFFNKKWAGYYFNQLEASKCMWDYQYTEGWDTGTGWLSENERKKIWDLRGINYDGTQILKNNTVVLR